MMMIFLDLIKIQLDALSASPQIESIEDMHNNMMFYLAIILFTVIWMMVNIVSYFVIRRHVYTWEYILMSIRSAWPIFILTLSFSFELLLCLISDKTDPFMTGELADHFCVIQEEGHQCYWSYQPPDFTYESSYSEPIDNFNTIGSSSSDLTAKSSSGVSAKKSSIWSYFNSSNSTQVFKYNPYPNRISVSNNINEVGSIKGSTILGELYKENLPYGVDTKRSSVILDTLNKENLSFKEVSKESSLILKENSSTIMNTSPNVDYCVESPGTIVQVLTTDYRCGVCYNYFNIDAVLLSPSYNVLNIMYFPELDAVGPWFGYYDYVDNLYIAPERILGNMSVFSDPWVRIYYDNYELYIFDCTSYSSRNYGCLYNPIGSRSGWEYDPLTVERIIQG